MRNWKVILTIVAIFLAGIITGAVLALRVVKTVATNQLSPERWPASFVENYKRRLKLTPAQLEKIRPIVEEGRKEWQGTMSNAISTHIGIMRRIDEEMTPLLTADQRKIQDQIREELRKRLRERFDAKQQPQSE